jgi:hypothetical protein
MPTNIRRFRLGVIHCGSVTVMQAAALAAAAAAAAAAAVVAVVELHSD